MGFFDNLEKESATPDPYQNQRNQLVTQIMRETSRSQPIERTEFPSAYTPEIVQERINQLRGRRTLGDVFAASGDAALAPLGRQMSADSDPHEFMDKVARQEQVRRYQQWQANQGRQEDRMSKLTRALGAINGAGGRGSESRQSGWKIPSSVMKDGLSNVSALTGLQRAIDTFKDDHQQVLGEYQGPLGDVAPWTVRQGWEDGLGLVGADKARAQQSSLWWAQFNQDVVAPLRHMLFGATLTAGEQAAWDAIQAITPSTKPDVVRQRLRAMHDKLHSGSIRRARVYSRQYGIDTVRDMFGNSLDWEEAGADTPDYERGAPEGFSIERASGPKMTSRGTRLFSGEVEGLMIEEIE